MNTGGSSFHPILLHFVINFLVSSVLTPILPLPHPGNPSNVHLLVCTCFCKCTASCVHIFLMFVNDIVASYCFLLFSLSYKVQVGYCLWFETGLILHGGIQRIFPVHFPGDGYYSTLPITTTLGEHPHPHPLMDPGESFVENVYLDMAFLGSEAHTYFVWYAVPGCSPGWPHQQSTGVPKALPTFGITRLCNFC